MLSLKNSIDTMKIRNATENDLKEIYELERKCFSLSEAASENDLKERLKHYPNHFWLLIDSNNKIISFIDGMTTDEEDLRDEMYENPGMHNERGSWQMIFGVCTHPNYRHKGNATRLMKAVIEDSKCRKGIVLTCKKELIDFYEKFGFTDEGVSEKSKHGNREWNQMRLTFKK